MRLLGFAGPWIYTLILKLPDHGVERRFAVLYHPAVPQEELVTKVKFEKSNPPIPSNHRGPIGHERSFRFGKRIDRADCPVG